MFAELPRGLVLVTGPTGSGKSTTLASLIDIVNRTKALHIMTVEDPIEFLHTHKRAVVNQREVGEDTHSFAEALRHVLRQDPDVILVGEMRDLETIQTALTAAETGHLVFATLHTQDAPQSIDRIIDVFPAHQQQQIRVQLAASLQGICTQQLLRTADGTGRAVAAEVLVATPAVRNLIREGKIYQIYSMMQAGGKFGMVTMDQNLAALVQAGKVTLEVALERCTNEEDLRRLVQQPELGRPDAHDLRVQGPRPERERRRGSLEADDATPRRRQAPPDGLHAHRDRGEARQVKLKADVKIPGSRRPGEAEGRRGLLAPVRDDDQLRALADPRAGDPRRADREPAAREGGRARSGSTSRRARRSRPRSSQHPKVFNRLYIAMVKSGEAGGVLDAVLMRLADTIEKQVELRRKVRSAMTYPVVVLSICSLIATAMLLFIVPQFKAIYADLGGQLPLPTRVLISISDLLKKFFPIFVLLGGVGVLLRSGAGSDRRRASPSGTRSSSGCRCSALLTRKTALARFSRTLAALTRSGRRHPRGARHRRRDGGNEVVVGRGARDPGRGQARRHARPAAGAARGLPADGRADDRGR